MRDQINTDLPMIAEKEEPAPRLLVKNPSSLTARDLINLTGVCIAMAPDSGLLCLRRRFAGSRLFHLLHELIRVKWNCYWSLINVPFRLPLLSLNVI